jgi:hypothetical protein
MGAEEVARLKAMAESEAQVTGLRMTAEAKEQAPTKTFMESAKERLRQMKVEAPAMGNYWASLKSKTRAAGDYATLRTRQGVSLFGEPNIGAIKTIVDRC